MDSILGLFNQLLGIVANIWDMIAQALWDWKIIIFVLMVILVVLYRIVMANLLYIKRHDKADWFIWGVLLIAQICTIFFSTPSLWLFAQGTVIAIIIVYTFIADKLNQAKTTIYANNIVYEDTSDKYDNPKEEEARERRENKKRKEGRIHRMYSKSRTHLIMGVPVFMMQLSFRISTTATQEQIGKMVKQLSDYYQEYNWRKLRTRSGVKYQITAEVKVAHNLVVPFDKSISDALDWYVVPLGAIDVSNKTTAKTTPYVWMMHDPKTEGKTYSVLGKTKTFAPAPQAFIVGSTGGGKSVLMNTIIAHFINKAKQDKQTELYLADAKMVEFAPYRALKEVTDVVMTIEDLKELLERFVAQMLERNAMMEKEGIKNIPLSGRIKLNKHIDINGKLIYGNEIIEFKTADGRIQKDYAMNLDGRTDIIEINMPEPEKEEKEDDKKSSGGFSW